jgi:hypothetical protein
LDWGSVRVAAMDWGSVKETVLELETAMGWGSVRVAAAEEHKSG